MIIDFYNFCRRMAEKANCCKKQLVSFLYESGMLKYNALINAEEQVCIVLKIKKYAYKTVEYLKIRKLFYEKIFISIECVVINHNTIELLTTQIFQVRIT